LVAAIERGRREAQAFLTDGGWRRLRVSGAGQQSLCNRQK
jgi:hypothetical protein